MDLRLRAMDRLDRSWSTGAMTNDLELTGTLAQATAATAVGCGVVGGVFFGFSTFVMPALRALPPAQGIAAMQSINVKAVNPVFMAALFGSGVLCLGVGVAAVTSAEGAARALLLVGSAAYLVGDVALTIAFHVPRNDALAALDPGAASSVERWSTYLAGWTAGNHVRAAAGIVAAASFALALRVR